MSMPCVPEKMAASSWEVPVYGYNGGQPNTPGLGYVFSGAANADFTNAAVLGCTGAPTDFVLPPGGNVDITFLDSTGKPATNANPPIDNLYLPLLTDTGVFETEPLDASGHQLVDRLAAGTLRIDGVSSTLNCTGPGVTPDPSVAGATVTVVAGTTVNITCKES
jgi:hypothetical protein